MDHTLESYLKRQPTEALLLILRNEKTSPNANCYPPEVYSLVRMILQQRQESTR